MLGLRVEEAESEEACVRPHVEQPRVIDPEDSAVEAAQPDLVGRLQRVGVRVEPQAGAQEGEVVHVPG